MRSGGLWNVFTSSVNDRLLGIEFTIAQFSLFQLVADPKKFLDFKDLFCNIVLICSLFTVSSNARRMFFTMVS